jgi:hypothetical protein
MASRLIGLTRTLLWKEFTGAPSTAELNELQRIAASSGKTVGMAGITSSFSVRYDGKEETMLVPSGGGFTLADEVVVTVIFDSQKSWKQIAPLSAITAQLLLDHEQGHYNFTALMARDCFIDLMQLKSQTFPDAPTGRSAAKTIVDTYQAKLKTVQKTYDSDTFHGGWVVPSSSFFPPRKESYQVKWEGFITSAFTVERQPQVIAPDGASYKLRILDAIANGGFII